MPFEIINNLVALAVIAVLAFIIIFPPIVIWYLWKMKRIKKHIPIDLKEKVLNEKIENLEKQVKGGSYNINGIKTKEETEETSREGTGGGSSIRGREGIGGGGSRGSSGGESTGTGEVYGGSPERTSNLQNKRVPSIKRKLQIQQTDEPDRNQTGVESNKSNLDEDWENLA